MAANELADLLCVLMLIYVTDCAWWLRTDAGAFVPLALGGWRWKLSSTVFSNQYGGIILTNLLPSLSGTFECSLFPVSLSPTHASPVVPKMIGMKSPSDVGTAVLYEQMASVEANNGEVFINGKSFVKGGGQVMAKHVVQVLTRLAESSVEQRAEELRRILLAAFDVETARKRLEDYTGKTFFVGCGSILVFGYIFAFVPTLLHLFGASTYLLVCLASPLPVMAAVVAFLFYRVHSAYYIDQTSERIVQVLKMLLFPPGAARANVALSREILTTYHPVAVASILCDRASFEAISRRALLDLTYAIEPYAEDGETVSTEKYYREQLREILTDFTKEAGLDIASFFKTPQQVDSSSESYCPKCLCQYEHAEGECIDCAGVALLPLHSREKRKSVAGQMSNRAAIEDTTRTA